MTVNEIKKLVEADFFNAYIEFECDGLIQAISFEDMRFLPPNVFAEYSREYAPYETNHEIMEMFNMVPLGFFDKGETDG